MRRAEVSSALPASAEVAWQALIDTESWPKWGRLVVSAEGEFTPGHQWTMVVRGDEAERIMHPYFLSMVPDRQLVFETRFGAGWAVRIRHWFDLLPDGPDRCTLRQRFEVTGLLVAPLWSGLRPGMLQFEGLGSDLARYLGQLPQQPLPFESTFQARSLSLERSHHGIPEDA